jgi:hypothetical protein
MLSEGMIIIETPIWANAIYDSDIDSVIDLFYFGD